MEEVDFQELWDALFAFKKYAHEQNILQEIETVNIEMRDSNLVNEVFDQAKHEIVLEGVHELCHEVLTELSQISTALPNKSDLREFWKLAEEQVRSSLHLFIDQLGKKDEDLKGLSSSIKKEIEDYLVHHIRYLKAKTGFIRAATLD